MKAAVLRNTSRALIVSMALALVPTAYAQAGLIGTEATLAVTQSSSERQRVRDFLQRDDVVTLLQQRGVDQQAALARVDGMTDSEVQLLAERVDQLPAGAGVVGVLFAVFVILLVTDILGFTKVFPFTRSVR